MKTYIKLFITLFCAYTTISCSDNLDENVYSSVTEQSYKYTSADFDPAVSSVYSYLRSLISHGGYWQAQEVTADGIVMPPNASGWDDGAFTAGCIIIHGTLNKGIFHLCGQLFIEGLFCRIK